MSLNSHVVHEKVLSDLTKIPRNLPIEQLYLHYFLMRTLAHFLQSSTKLSILSEKSILFLNKYFNKVFRVIHLSIMHDKKIS